MLPPPMYMSISVGKSERQWTMRRSSVSVPPYTIAWGQLRASRRDRDRRVSPLYYALGAPSNRRPWT
jgi:hypothetical protein